MSSDPARHRIADMICPDEAATAALAARLGARLRAGDFVALTGELGAGKTAFARGLIRAALGDAAAEVPSPTFTLVQTYEAPELSIWHFDLYRVEDPSELVELGWDEALGEALMLVEWPGHAGGDIPADRLEVHITFGAHEGERRVTIDVLGAKRSELDDLGA